jgi:hypothetical protein
MAPGATPEKDNSIILLRRRVENSIESINRTKDITMKKTIMAAILTILALAALPFTIDRAGYHAGTPAFALCSATEIMNNCCFKFINTLEGGSEARPQQTREQMAVAEFKRCLRSDLGCSMEMTEMKSKGIGQIRQICQ